MLGVIAGDVIGSVYEHRRTKSTEFPLFHLHSRFTDDTVLTVATAHALVAGVPYDRAYRDFGRRYPNAGYGATFLKWLHDPEPRPYNSWGNGAAMRVAPVGLAFRTVQSVLRQAEQSAAVTHDHPEGIKGAQATALAVFLARTGASKETIRTELATRFGYDLQRTVEAIRPQYAFDVSCQGSVPEAVIAFLDSDSFEGAVRLAISLGGDSDTQAAIAGGIAHAFHGAVPAEIADWVLRKLPEEFVEVIDTFTRVYGPR